MSGTAAIVAALPREIAALVKGRKADADLLRSRIYCYFVGHGDAVVVAAGMGAVRATRAVEIALREVHELYSNPPDEERFLPDVMISVGLAGSCTPELRPGEVVIAREVVDTLTGEHFTTADASAPHVLVSTPAIASTGEKQRLHASYGASVVDMEASTVARLAHARGIPFRAIKAVSDAHDFELSELGRFADQRGHFRTTAFGLYIALRPGLWRPMMRLGKDSGLALAALAAKLREEVHLLD